MKENNDQREKEAQESMLHIADDNPEINYDRLKESAQYILKKRTSLPFEEYRKITELFYNSMDMEERGSSHFLSDVNVLIKYLEISLNIIDTHLTPALHTNAITVIGAGEGRMIPLIIEMGKKTKQKIKKIIINDLLESHIETIKGKLSDTYGTDKSSNIDGIEIEYREGDFGKINIPFSDIAIATWFVTSEILDPSSVSALQEHRSHFFKKIRTTIGEHGFFFEEIPDILQSGFYYLSRSKSAHILTEMGFLPEESENFSLTNIPKENNGFPYHIRYMPKNGGHGREMTNAGFYSLASESLIFPRESVQIYPADIIKIFEEYKNIEEVKRYISTLLINNSKNEEGDDRRIKRITMWSADPY
ncbi:hypothetical protein IPN35_03415 [Candidatus Peregrinibacteria bacterium]|nr:MAG: hypothetical protein IPN35_03415 [Candidatus Peregrinibacteria bacterium]